MKKKQFDKIMTRLDFLTERLIVIEEMIENKIKKDVPPPPFEPLKDIFIPSYIPPTSCSLCGIKLDSVMGYVCNNTQCPTFPVVRSIQPISYNANTSVSYDETQAKRDNMTNPGNLNYEI